MRGAVSLNAHDVGDDAGVELDAEPARDFLALRRVVQEYRRSSGRCHGSGEVSGLGSHQVVVEVVHRRLVDRGGTVCTQGGGDVVVQLPGEGDGGLPQGTGDGQELQAALLERCSRVVNENKCICHGWSPPL